MYIHNILNFIEIITVFRYYCFFFTLDCVHNVKRNCMKTLCKKSSTFSLVN